jgi:hypothetical protein
MNVPYHALNRPSVANVTDAETQYHAHEFLDVTVQPKPIYISPNEVYAMHGLLAQHIDRLVRSLVWSPGSSYPLYPRVLRVMIHYGRFFMSLMAYHNLAAKNLKMLGIGQLHWI